MQDPCHIILFSQRNEKLVDFARFEVLTGVTMKHTVIRLVTACSSEMDASEGSIASIFRAEDKTQHDANWFLTWLSVRH
jgi:hypothetical protein